MNIRRYLIAVAIAATLSLSACTLPTDPTFARNAGETAQPKLLTSPETA